MSEKGPWGWQPRVIEGGLAPEFHALTDVLAELRAYTLSRNFDLSALPREELQPYIDVSNEQLVVESKKLLTQATAEDQGDPLVLLANMAAAQYVIESRLAPKK
jgi:hypothetical protein